MYNTVFLVMYLVTEVNAAAWMLKLWFLWCRFVLTHFLSYSAVGLNEDELRLMKHWVVCCVTNHRLHSSYLFLFRFFFLMFRVSFCIMKNKCHQWKKNCLCGLTWVLCIIYKFSPSKLCTSHYLPHFKVGVLFRKCWCIVHEHDDVIIIHRPYLIFTDNTYIINQYVLLFLWKKIF